MPNSAKIISYALQQAGVPMAEAIAAMIANLQKAAIPMYLYGTTAMGVMYNGVELPDIESVWTPELKKTHPYAVINYAGDIGGTFPSGVVAYILIISDTPIVTGSEVTAYCFSLIEDRTGDTLYTQLAGVWNDITEGSPMTDVFTVDRLGVALWANHDILDEDLLVALAASDPVYSDIGLRVSDTDTILYHGAVLPELPEYNTETYPHAAISLECDYGDYGRLYTLAVTTGDMHISADATRTLHIGEDSHAYIWFFATTDGVANDNGIPVGKWAYMFGGPAADGTALSLGTTLWSNCGIPYPDGTTCMVGSAPIQVTGTVEYINNVFIYETIK